MVLLIDFGNVALAGAFLKPEEFAYEAKYPLRLYFCEDCFGVQVIDKISATILFENYFYFSSSIHTLKQHFEKYAAEVTARFLVPERASVIEFGCNDGVLLRPLADQGIRTVIGVDPAKNVVRAINDPRVVVVNDFFNEQTADLIIRTHGKADMILANNVYAHIPDIQGVTRAVRKILKDDGVFIFEVHYLGKILDELQYDMIYHEHLYYYSLLALINHFSRYEMMVFDVQPIPIHGGSMRYYVCKKGSKHSTCVSTRLEAMRNDELSRGFNRAETYTQFATGVANRKDKLLAVLNSCRKAGKRVVGYGASGRANTMIQYCGIDGTYMDYMIDDAPAKLGFYTPGSHFLIRPSSVLRTEEQPDYLLVFAWSFLEEISKRCVGYMNAGGRMIIPLPDVRVVPPSAN